MWTNHMSVESNLGSCRVHRYCGNKPNAMTVETRFTYSGVRKRFRTKVRQVRSCYKQPSDRLENGNQDQIRPVNMKSYIGFCVNTGVSITMVPRKRKRARSTQQLSSCCDRVTRLFSVLHFRHIPRPQRPGLLYFVWPTLRSSYCFESFFHLKSGPRGTTRAYVWHVRLALRGIGRSRRVCRALGEARTRVRIIGRFRLDDRHSLCRPSPT